MPVEQGAEQASDADLTRVDRQGAVEVTAAPRNLDGPPEEPLEFEVILNTHSVDLSMDLASLSTLETDTGIMLSATSWSGGSGHHVQGILAFPRRAPDGSSIDASVSRMTLTIRDLDVPQRVFTWELGP